MDKDDDLGDKSLTIFKTPKAVKGTVFLSFSHSNGADEQWLYMPALRRVKKIASDNNIKLQYEILAGYGEDGSMFQKSRGGIPAINLGIPTRYLHCHNSVIDLEDYRNGINLVNHILIDLDKDKIKDIKNLVD